MSQTLISGQAKPVAATGNVKSSTGTLLGVFVSDANTTPTLAIYDSATTTTTLPLIGTFTPVSATWYPMPIGFSSGLYVVISGVVNCTFVYV